MPPSSDYGISMVENPIWFLETYQLFKKVYDKNGNKTQEEVLLTQILKSTNIDKIPYNVLEVLRDIKFEKTNSSIFNQ